MPSSPANPASVWSPPDRRRPIWQPASPRRTSVPARSWSSPVADRPRRPARRLAGDCHRAPLRPDHQVVDARRSRRPAAGGIAQRLCAGAERPAGPGLYRHARRHSRPADRGTRLPARDHAGAPARRSFAHPAGRRPAAHRQAADPGCGRGRRAGGDTGRSARVLNHGPGRQDRRTDAPQAGLTTETQRHLDTET